MLRQDFSDERERIIGKAIAPVLAELRLVDVRQFLAHLTLEQFANIADIINSAAERHFAPGFLVLGHGGETQLDWASIPSVTIDLVLRPAGVTAYISVILHAAFANVRLNYIHFQQGGADAFTNTRLLEHAIRTNMIISQSLMSQSD